MRKLMIIILVAVLVLTGCAREQTLAPQRDATTVVTGEDALICLEYSRFSGAFPEDGTGRQVASVAAILVKNDSAKFLDYARIECAIGENRTGVFKVTGLPAGQCAWVLEQSAMTIVEGEHFQAKPCTDYAFRSDVVTQTDKFDLQVDGNNVTVTNRSKETLENVCIYYKVLHEDGNYFGGITYMLNFGTLSPGQATRKQSGYFGNSTRIVRYSFQTKA